MPIWYGERVVVCCKELYLIANTGAVTVNVDNILRCFCSGDIIGVLIANYFYVMAIEQRVVPVSDDAASDVAAQVFQNFKDKKGSVPNWARVMANRPEVLASFSGLLSVTMGPGLVEQDNKWKCAYVVSKINKCQYCLGVVEGMLGQLGVSPENIADVISDEKVTLKDDEKAAVEYAKILTTDPVNVPEETYEEMKKHYDDAQLVEITAAIGLFNYINRFNDGLGVLPEGS